MGDYNIDLTQINNPIGMQADLSGKTDKVVLQGLVGGDINVDIPTGDVTQSAKMFAGQTATGQKISGLVIVSKTTDGYTVTVSLDPSNPSLDTPPPSSKSENAFYSAGSNYVGIFNAIMQKISSLKMQIQYLDAKNTINIRNTQMEIGKENAELAYQNQQLQAEQTRLDAIQQFVSAGLSAWQLAGSHGAAKKADAEADEAYGRQEKAAKDELETEKLTDPKLKKPDSAVIGDKRKLEEQQKADIEAFNKRVANKQKEYDKIKADKANYRSSAMRTYDTTQRNVHDMLNSAVQGTTSMLKSGYQMDLAAVQKQQQLNDAYLKQFDLTMQNYQTDQRNAADDFNSLMQQLQQFVNSDFRWSGGA